MYFFRFSFAHSSGHFSVAKYAFAKAHLSTTIVSQKRSPSKLGREYHLPWINWLTKTNTYHTLISTSTPLGNSSFINASIVFEDEE